MPQTPDPRPVPPQTNTADLTDTGLAHGLGFKRFLPGAVEVLVPTSSRRAALAGLALYSACRPDTARVQRMAWTATALLGPRALPGRSGPWLPPMDIGEWWALADCWRREIGNFDSVAVTAQPTAGPDAEDDPGPATLRVLLMQAGEPLGMAKVVRGSGASLTHEALALTLMERSRPRSFRVAGVIALGESQGWNYLLTRPLPPRIHRVPEDPPLAQIVGEIHVGLAALPRPGFLPKHWHAMHGAMTPWTLREVRSRSLVLFDWEEAAWGPPGADEVIYRASKAAITGTNPAPIHVREAVDFWREEVAKGRAPKHGGAGFAARLMKTLDKMVEGAMSAATV